MNKTFVKEMQKILTEQKNQLMSKNYENCDIDIDGDETDEIQGNILAFVNDQLSNRDKDKLSKIESALKKIEDGTFGVCEECGEDISEKRLVINPGFITCIGCAEELEMLSKRKNR